MRVRTVRRVYETVVIAAFTVYHSTYRLSNRAEQDAAAVTFAERRRLSPTGQNKHVRADSAAVKSLQSF